MFAKSTAQLKHQAGMDRIQPPVANARPRAPSRQKSFRFFRESENREENMDGFREIPGCTAAIGEN